VRAARIVWRKFDADPKRQEAHALGGLQENSCGATETMGKGEATESH